ncbi:M61 family metallopeptidase [Pedobacter sp. SYSU D00535]|uniref:M61 family metallopeptidase n=1 Tax=Pedobacter sp. SYSU D00535 TaxID=2810308 RepID=UPI001F6023D8|nr:PDZ domain-containing protein [Pedobacter sp. SYSU D00535]
MITSSEDLQAETKIAFNVSFSEPQAHYTDVEMVLSGLTKDVMDVKMPVWAPGSYLIREFAKNVEGFSAIGANNKSLLSEKISKNTWRINTAKNQTVRVKYRVYCFEISVRTSFVDAAHAFLSPTGIFMYVDGMIKQPATVSIEPAKGWDKISTGLEPVKGKQNTFFAPDFDVLYDSPIEIGNHDTFEFTAAGVKHEVAMYGGGNYNKQRLSADISKIVEAETAIFGENPNKRYVFIVHNYQNGGGGLEHLNSTVLGARRFGYTDEGSYKDFLGLVAHEYFHLWNVKRLRPKALGPFDYDNENYTTNLWISEGFTAYYDNLMLRRTGFYSPQQYLDILTNDIGTVENQPGNKVQPLSEASFDAWIKYYRPNENSRNSTVSYYTKGALVGMIMDLEIIAATQGAKSLDDVLKAMYDEYFKKQRRGFTDAEFKAMAEKIAGKSLDKIYNEYINGTESINYNNYLGHAGVYLSNELSGKSLPYLGVASVARDGKLIITGVVRGTTAWVDGLNVNDEIIAIDNFRVGSQAEIDRTINGKRVGDKVNILISRDGILQTIEAKLTANPNGRYRLEADPNATPEQLAIRKKWLNL